MCDYCCTSLILYRLLEFICIHFFHQVPPKFEGFGNVVDIDRLKHYNQPYGSEARKNQGDESINSINPAAFLTDDEEKVNTISWCFLYITLYLCLYCICIHLTLCIFIYFLRTLNLFLANLPKIDRTTNSEKPGCTAFSWIYPKTRKS